MVLVRVLRCRQSVLSFNRRISPVSSSAKSSCSCRLPHQIRQVRSFQTSRRSLAVRPFLLADIGEGIRECEVIQWFVEPEARVEQFDKLCEVQSDKASVEITSRFDGVIKKLHYEAGDMAIVGKPLVDIDIQSETSPEDEALIKEPQEDLREDPTGNAQAEVSNTDLQISQEESLQEQDPQGIPPTQAPSERQVFPTESSHSHAALATPAVRRLTRELDIPISSIKGTGRDGRVLKEDVYAHTSKETQSAPSPTSTSTTVQLKETVRPLTSIQHQMFKTMTRTLSIPHFLFSDTYDITDLSHLRSSLNTSLSSDPTSTIKKLSYLPFIIKAVSTALHSYPILNARLDTSGPKPTLTYRAAHNIGIAIDTPGGLLVPVIKSVHTLSILEIAAEVTRLSSLAEASKLSTNDFSNGTITVSNIGSIGGTTVAPVIVDGQLSILGIGKVRTVPAFDSQEDIVRRQEVVCSWSADHRVVDGATMARFAGKVGEFLSAPGRLVVNLR